MTVVIVGFSGIWTRDSFLTTEVNHTVAVEQYMAGTVTEVNHAVAMEQYIWQVLCTWAASSPEDESGERMSTAKCTAGWCTVPAAVSAFRMAAEHEVEGVHSISADIPLCLKGHRAGHNNPPRTDMHVLSETRSQCPNAWPYNSKGGRSCYCHKHTSHHPFTG